MKNEVPNEQSSVEKEFALESIISSAVQLPGVKVERRKFLAEIFASDEYPIQDILDLGPIAVGVSQDKLALIAHKLILKRTSQSSAASFVTGIPGGLAMAATIPADVLQFFGMALRLAQELSYLYGAKDLWQNGQLDDEKVKNQLLLYCRHSEADEGSRCHKMRINAVELEQAVFITLKKQMEAAASLNPDGTIRLEAAAPKRSEYEQQIETLQDGKRLLYERYLLGEIDLDTYKAEKAACDELLLKTKNAYAVVLAQAKQKQEEQARHDNRQEAARAVFNSEGLTAELTDLLIDRVLVYPDNRIEIAYKIKDIFD